MHCELVLQTAGYTVVFSGHWVQLGAQPILDVLIKTQLHSMLSELTLHSVPIFIRLNDLQRLVTYLETHVHHLQQDVKSTSDVFVPLELGFQAQAYIGDVLSDDDGEFSLLFLVNTGVARNDEDGAHVYVGAETIVDIGAVRDFVQQVRAAIAEMQRAQDTSNEVIAPSIKLGDRLILPTHKRKQGYGGSQQPVGRYEKQLV